MIRLLWSPWKEDLFQLISGAAASVDLAVAYISKATASELVSALPVGVNLRVLTRCSDRDFYSEIADVNMFEFLASHSRVQLRAMPNLHAKLYIVDGQTAILGSGNLTRAGLGEGRNHNEEAGLFVDDPSLTREMCDRWNDWWQQAAPVDQQFVQKLSEKVAELPKRPRGANRIGRAISDLARIRPALVRFPFKVGKAFLDRKQGHPITIPTAYRGRLEAKGLAPADNIVIVCPDGSRMRGRILYCPPEKAGDYGSYYQIRVRGGYPGDAISRLNKEQRIAVEISRVNRTVQVHLRLVK